MNRNLFLVLFSASGFAALVYEIAWTRLFYLFLGTTTYAFSIVIASFLLGLSLGSYLVSKFQNFNSISQNFQNFNSINSTAQTFALVELLIAMTVLLLLPAFNSLDFAYLYLHSLFSSFEPFLSAQLVLVFSLLVLPASLMGMTFPLAVKLFSQEQTLGKDIGLLFSFNTAGGILGSLAAGFILIPFLGLVHAIAIAALLNIAIAVIVYKFYTNTNTNSNSYTEWRKLFLPIFAAAILLVAFIGFSFSIDTKAIGAYHGVSDLTPAAWQDLKSRSTTVFAKEGAYGFVTIDADNASPGLIALKVNGKTDASTEPVDVSVHLMLGYLPLLVHEKPDDVLHIGLGSGLTLMATEHFAAAKRITVVEINPDIVSAAQFLSNVNENALGDPRVSLILADARNYLLVNSTQYDLIISEPSDLWVSGEINLFTKEFYEIAKSRLKPGGIFVQWIPAYEFSTEETQIALRTSATVFRHTQIFTVGPTYILLHSNEPINLNFTAIEGKILSHQKVLYNLGKIARVHSLNSSGEKLLPALYGGNEATLSGIGAVGLTLINTDNWPLLEFRAAANNAYRPANRFLGGGS